MFITRRQNDFPNMYRCTQRLKEAAIPIDQIPSIIKREFEKQQINSRLKKGQSVAIAAGSRGIDKYALVIQHLVALLKELGTAPFIFPAMGSHGGASAEGQRDVLAVQGITEESMGCPIRSSMEVIELGPSQDDLMVYLDKNASQADHIIVVNRIKAHTNFRGKLESGLCKMLAIGAGKHAQALAIHTHGVKGLTDYMPNVAKVILEKVSVLGGVAMIEDGHHHLSHLEFVDAHKLITREPELLEMANSMYAKLPFDQIDLLVVDQIGKNISGTGMDTNIVGRCRLLDFVAFPKPEVRCLVALDLSDETHGNAIGMGLCDLVSDRLAKKVDPISTAINCITGLSPQMAALPISLPCDRDVIATALDFFCGPKRASEVPCVRIKNTLSMNEFLVSEAMLTSILKNPNLSVSPEVYDWKFNEAGNLW